jgi:DNA replication protein DnaC
MTTAEWRRMYPNGGDCPYCHGALEVRAGDGTVYQCICLMMSWRDRQLETRSRYQSRFEDASLDQLVYNDDNGEDLERAVDAAVHFMNHLDSWLVLSGPCGTGKTHILRAIATELRPIGLFITATDFERMVFENLKNESLDSFILAISQAPVLLFDDLGAEYGGKEFIKAQISSIFIAREAIARDLPTVVTTNLERSQLKTIPRVGSRLLNQDVVKFLPLNVSDHRTRDFDAKNPERIKKKWNTI